jgi:hypothetical protein
MTDDAWIAYRGAVALIGDDGAVLRALRTGAIKSRGRGDYREEEDIPADRWAEWTFLPTCTGAGSMRKFCWLVPPGKEQVRVCTGFGEIRLLRADVERLAAPPASAEQIEEKDIEPQRFPGRPTARGQIVAKMRERFAAGEADKSLAAEARWLMRWAQKEYPNDTSVPRTSKGMENSLRDEFNRLKGERAASE